MNYDFNQIIDRKNTNCIKHDFALERGKPEGILPLWVADMDFQVPQQVITELNKAVSHGIFGYSEVKCDYYETVQNWFKNYHQWEPKESWLIKTPGIVYAIAQAVRAFSKENDAILIQQPVYYPFSETIRANNRKLVVNSLLYQDGRYTIDFEDFEDQIIKHQVKVFLLCSPHNPVGRVWTIEELKRMGEICLAHGVIIVSDEIHCDFTYPGHTHTVFASLNEDFANQSIICTSPSKTFNLAGLQVSNIFIKNPKYRDKFKHQIIASGYSQLNTLGLIACKAAYDYGDEWLTQLKNYLQENLNFIRDFINNHLPQIKLIEPEGTYLVWLDFRSLNLNKQELEELIIHKANLWLDAGHIFGNEGESFQRINIACPRSLIQKAFEQLAYALNS